MWRTREQGRLGGVRKRSRAAAIVRDWLVFQDQKIHNVRPEKDIQFGEDVMGTAEWQSVVVALALLILIGAISVSAIRKYPTVDEALKVVAAFAGLLGVVTGTFATYFFTRQPLIEARQQAAVYKTILQTDVAALKSAADSANRAAAGAQSTANQALSTAQTNSTAIEAMNEKTDRMFKKSL